MLSKIAVVHNLLASLWLILALDFHAFKLVLERNGDPHHLHSLTSHRAKGGEGLRLKLPFLYAFEAEDVSALGALSGILE